MEVTTTLDDEVQSILDRFDFEKVLAYMTLKDWENKPDLETLTRKATTLLCNVRQNFNNLTLIDHSLGLMVYKDREDRLHLFFFIEHKTNVI
jgi:hypothetical protein